MAEEEDLLRRRQKTLKRLYDLQLKNPPSQVPPSSSFPSRSSVLWWKRRRSIPGISASAPLPSTDWFASSYKSIQREHGEDVGARILQALNSPKPEEELVEALGFSDSSLEFIAKALGAKQYVGKQLRNLGKSKGCATQPHSNDRIGRSTGQGKVFVKGARIGGGLLSNQNAVQLPPNTTRMWYELRKHVGSKEAEQDGVMDSGSSQDVLAKYEQVVVPARPPPPVSVNPELDAIPTTRFGVKSQKAFQGIPNLNRLQSRLFATAYETSENLLVCAPTGAGKTNVAMMAIAREIDRETDPRMVKIVYVAPMKALAQEVVAKFSERLKPLKMVVRELTGDTQLSRSEIERTQIVVTTPEKWDVITRKSGGDGTLVELVQVLIIDEVHLVGEDRGPVIEALVARTIRQVERRQKMVRIVGLSATLPNYVDVAMFLRVNPDRGMFFFDSSFRPVPLEQTFIGVSLPGAPTAQSVASAAAAATAKQLDLSQGTPQTANAKLAEKLRAKSAYQTQKKLEQAYNELATQVALESVEKGNQVMVFVHTRKDTAKTAKALLEVASVKFHAERSFSAEERQMQPERDGFKYRVSKSKNSDLQELFARGLGIHHAGMAREDRSLTEEMFTKGAISVLCCTATLAWGVNLPAHTVIVKGTQIYSPERGGACELNSADVFQCFGRAGRPQYDTSGEAILITEHAQLNRYLAMLTHALPLESKLVPALPDALNAEIVSGTVSTLEEASDWLSYTFLFVRMLKSPTAYGVTLEEREDDPHLVTKRLKLVAEAARQLSDARMVRIGAPAGGRSSNYALGGYSPKTPLGVTDLGRVASHYYIHHETVDTLFNAALRPILTFPELLEAICLAQEFTALKVREEEGQELRKLSSNACAYELADSKALDDARGKTFVLFQTYISRFPVETFTLHSDMNYISQNASRICRAVFEVALARGWAHCALQSLALCASIEKRCWASPIQHPLRQLVPIHANIESVGALEAAAREMRDPNGESLFSIGNFTADRLAMVVPALSSNRAAKLIHAYGLLPKCSIEIVLKQPITSGLLRLQCRVTKQFQWNERLHGSSQAYYLFADDGDWILHSERIILGAADEFVDATFTVPLFSNPGPGLAVGGGEDVESQVHPPDHYYIRIESDSGWLECGDTATLDLGDLELPADTETKYTDLLDLDPLPIRALKNPNVEFICTFTHFNPVQTQCFHALYHRDESCLIGAPTGSGKTTLAELAMWRVFFPPSPNTLFDPSTVRKSGTVVYVAPMRALVSERAMDWKPKLAKLGKTVVELTGDSSPSGRELKSADLIVATPEKFEIVTRFWKSDNTHFLRSVELVVFDEIHLLGEERGAALEALVSRIKTVKFPAERERELHGSTKKAIRLLGLSTALANAQDLGKWFSRDGTRHDVFVYNFRPAVRVVPLEVHVSGFPGLHYCPRMASMNKPAFHAIEKYSKDKPVLIFVASRRQTRLTAFDLISLCAASDEPRRFLRAELGDDVRVDDSALRDSLQFGIALHHASLSKSDRQLSERAFASGACQVLIATATLAWGVNLPAHLVIIKGTEFFDAAKRRYEPFAVTDVLQMMGRAGRPQFGDETGIAVILVHDRLKAFYKRFLYEPFPVESNLLRRLTRFVNAEIASGTINSLTTAKKYVSETYLSIRVEKNPTFYGCKHGESPLVFWQRICLNVVNDLKKYECCAGGAGGDIVSPTKLGTIAARFDLSPDSAFFLKKACAGFIPPTTEAQEATFAWVLEQACKSDEFCDVPVRHNEDELNELLATRLKFGLGSFGKAHSGSPHCKSFLLLQALFQDVRMPIHDYVSDSVAVCDVASRVAPAVAEICCTVRGDFGIVENAAKMSALLVANRGGGNGSGGAFRASIKKAVMEKEKVSVSVDTSSSCWIVLCERATAVNSLRFQAIALNRARGGLSSAVEFLLVGSDKPAGELLVFVVSDSIASASAIMSKVNNL